MLESKSDLTNEFNSIRVKHHQLEEQENPKIKQKLHECLLNLNKNSTKRKLNDPPVILKSYTYYLQDF